MDGGGGESEDDGVFKVKKMTKTPYQWGVLEKTYLRDQYPSEKLRGKLSKQLGLSDRQLQMWFCHRRIKEKKMQSEKRSKKVISGSGGGVDVMMVSGEGFGGNEVGGSGGSGSGFRVPGRVPGSGSSVFGHGSSVFGHGSSVFGHGSSVFGHGERGVSRAGGPVVSGSVSGSGRVAVAASSEMPSVKMYYESPQVVSEARAVAFVEAQLGERLRDNGPILGTEFDPLPNGAFGAPPNISNGNSGNKGRTRATTDTVMSLSSDELSNEAGAAKILKSSLVENVGNKTDSELLEFILMNKQIVGILEQKLPEKAVAVKEAIKCYEDEIERRARFECPKENGRGTITCTTQVKVEVDNDMVEDGIAVPGENTETHEEEKTSPQVDNIKLVIQVEEGEQSVSQNESIDTIIAEEECARTFQTVPENGDKNQASTQDISAELKKFSCVLSMLSSPNKFYIPQGDPLDEEAEKAKQTLIQLLDKKFETIVGSPDEEMVKSCLKILTKNLHKLPRFQGRVIETLNTEFDTACQNWEMCRISHQSCIAFEVQQGDNLGVLKKWQEQDMKIESDIETMDADILRLKAELREIELARENLVKAKSDLFDQSKMSVDEVGKLLQDVVTVKLQSDVAVDNMNQLAAKWERTRENFKMK